ncbi:hypothetical protein CALVIDRAFT_565289 [Calocera viscosa TUFC12733]|uniref:Uncharacterized protein n=1 Tax=Calocera viscosa (strain TUFC12733) TaxID=1330018 RepID=A0A167KQ80_CALVF|nr:hypothetical protein CALVIDRAFT_565289 [Calocera viscosa TUFC12733]
MDYETTTQALSRLLDHFLLNTLVPHDIDGSRLAKDPFWAQWDTGDVLGAYEEELTVWPGGPLCALRVCYGFTEPVYLLAARSDGTTSDFIFSTGADAMELFLALQLDNERLSPAESRYRLCRSDIDAKDACTRLESIDDSPLKLSPHPDALNQLYAIHRDIRVLRGKPSPRNIATRKAVLRRMSGMLHN